VVISVFFSVLGLSLGAGLIIDFVSVRDGLIIAPTDVIHAVWFARRPRSVPINNSHMSIR